MSSKSRQKRAYRQQAEGVEGVSASQLVAVVLRTCGGNLVEVEDCDGQRYLSSLPTRLRRCVWLRRGSFVLLEPIAEGRRVRAEVERVLTERQLAELRQMGRMPQHFFIPAAGDRHRAPGQTLSSPQHSHQQQSELDLYVNTNRRLGVSDCSDDSSDSCSEEELSECRCECRAGCGATGGCCSECGELTVSDSAGVSQSSSSTDQPLPARAPRWRKVLYKRQPYPDNYVGTAFLAGLRCNTSVSYTDWQAISASSALLQQSSCVPLLYTAYGQLASDALRPHVLILAVVLVSLVGRACHGWLGSTGRGCGDGDGNVVWDEVRLAVVCVLVATGLSPLLATLTDAVSTDTVHAFSFVALCVHVLVHDYDGPISAVVSRAISLNAALFASLCLSSRLQSYLHVLALLSLATALFALAPRLRTRIWRCCGDSVLFCGAWLQAGLSIWIVSVYMAVSYFSLLLLLVFFLIICPLAPLLYSRAQVYKHAICGPWDEAVIDRCLSVHQESVSQMERGHYSSQRSMDYQPVFSA